MKMTKKVLSILLVIAMLLSTMFVNVFANTNPTITVASVTAEAGEEVDVTIDVSNNPGIVTMKVAVAYDAALTLTKVVDGGILGTAYHAVNELNKNPYTLYWADNTATSNITANGTAVTLTFKVAEGAEAKDYPITLTYDPDELYDVNEDNVEFAVVNGKVTVEAGTTPPPAITDPTITVASVTAEAGEEVDVTIDVSNNPGIVTMKVAVAYDAALTLTKVVDGGILGTAYHAVNELNKNPYTLYWADNTATSNITANGTAVTLTFKVAEGAEAKDYAITLTYDPDEVYDVNEDNVEFAVVNGKVTVEAGTTPPPATTYTIEFADEDGTVLDTVTVNEGEVPATDVVPTKDATAEYTYTFAGWTPEVVAATEDATYTATYDAVKNKYAVKFVNYDGTELQNTEVEYGAVPEYTGETPVKPADDEFEYSFNGWDAEVVAVTGTVTYTATYDSIPVGVPTFTITFVDWNDEVLGTKTVAEGAMPEFPDPTRAADENFTYEFAGWDPELVEATEDATYTATYTATEIVKYTIIFVDELGETLAEIVVVEGTMPVYPNAEPTKEGDAQYTYTFAGWENEDGIPGLAEATANATYTATFTETVNKYTVTFTDAEGNKLDEVVVEYGTELVFDEAKLPTKAPVYDGLEVKTYEFEWAEEFVEVTEDVTYTGDFVETVEPRTITAITANNVKIAKADYNSEDAAVVAAAIAEVVKVEYVFDDEGGNVAVAAEDVTITANLEAKTALVTVGEFSTTIEYSRKASGYSTPTIGGGSTGGSTSTNDKKDDATTEDKKDDATTEDKADDATTEEPKDEEPKAEEPKVEEPKAEEPSTFVPTPEKPFADIADENSHWAAKSAYKLYSKGIVSGDANGNINLDNNITRAETAKLAVLVHDIAINSTDLTNTDALDVADWAKDYISTAVNAGIINGYADGTVKPNANITREEMVTIIIRALGITFSEVPAPEFADADKLTWSKDYVAAAVQLGFVNGYEDGTFRGDKNITRGEAMAIFERVMAFKDALANAQ